MALTERKTTILKVDTEVNRWLTEIQEISRGIGEKGFIKGGYTRDFVYNHYHGTTFEPGDLDIMFTGSINLILRDLLDRDAIFRLRRNRKKTPVFELDLPTNHGGIPIDIGILMAPGFTYQTNTEVNALLEEDAKLSDFTINSLFLPLGKSLSIRNIIDPLGGIEDAKKNVIRMVAPDVFIRNPECMLRAVVLIDRMQAELDEETTQAIVTHAPKIREAPSIVIRQNIEKIKESDTTDNCYNLLREFGLLEHLSEVL